MSHSTDNIKQEALKTNKIMIYCISCYSVQNKCNNKVVLLFHAKWVRLEILNPFTVMDGTVAPNLSYLGL